MHRTKGLFAFCAAFCVAAFPAGAEGAAGLYFQLGGGFGNFSGDQLVVTELDGAGDLPNIEPAECCPGPGLAMQFRLGFAILGFAGPEFSIMGTGFSGFNGGAGMIGGGIRAFPIKFISLAGVDTKGFPIDIGLGANLGWMVLGKDFAYSGTFWDFDINIEYFLTSFMSAGLKFDVLLPNLGDFVFTDYKNDRGRCLDDGANQDLSNQMTPINKSDSQCAGTGPSTTFITPQLVFTFHLDILDV